jgi:hypothetical protein
VPLDYRHCCHLGKSERTTVTPWTGPFRLAKCGISEAEAARQRQRGYAELSVPTATVYRVNEAISPMMATQLRHQVLTAAAMAAQALTDTEQPPESRLRTLMDAHGRILAVRGPGSPMTFSCFRELLTGDLARLLPGGVPAEEMEGVQLITPDGLYDDDLYDLEQEQKLVLRTLARTVRAGRASRGEGLASGIQREWRIRLPPITAWL